MFETRISKSWGIGEDILARYFLESLHEDIDGGMLLFVVRDKQTGRKLWLKVSDTSDSANSRLAAEASVWEGIKHPHLLSPCQQKIDTLQNYIAYPWRGEVSFNDVDKTVISPSDLVRISVGLLDGVIYLQSLSTPVVHNGIGLTNLCLATTHHWPMLTGFHMASSEVDDESLLADRKSCYEAISSICASSGASEEFSENIATPAMAWVSNGAEAAEELSIQMDREFIRRVTADL